METGKLVYLSGKIADNENCQKDFACAERFLSQIGYVVINPARIKDEIPEITNEQFTQICYKLIDISQIIFMVSGWKDSKTANAELTYAKSLGKKTMYQDYYAPFRKVGESEEN